MLKRNRVHNAYKRKFVRERTLCFPDENPIAVQPNIQESKLKFKEEGTGGTNFYPDDTCSTIYPESASLADGFEKRLRALETMCNKKFEQLTDEFSTESSTLQSSLNKVTLDRAALLREKEVLATDLGQISLRNEELRSLLDQASDIQKTLTYEKEVLTDKLRSTETEKRYFRTQLEIIQAHYTALERSREEGAMIRWLPVYARNLRF